MMAVIDELLGRFRRQGPVVLGTEQAEPDAAVPRPLALITWALTIWTALGGLALVFLHDDVSRLFAAGLRDDAGQRLLGMNLLLLAVVYGSIAARRRVHAVLGFLPLVSQILIAIVIAYDVLAGNRSFGWSAMALLVSLLFAVLLAAFRLAGEPLLPEQRRQPPMPSPTEPAPPQARAQPEEMPTERLTAQRPGAELQQHRTPAAPEKDSPPDESVLGI